MRESNKRIYKSSPDELPHRLRTEVFYEVLPSTLAHTFFQPRSFTSRQQRQSRDSDVRD